MGKTCEFNILNHISKHVMLVKLIDTAGNIKYAVSIIVCWIYDLNYKRALLLIESYLDFICYPYKDEKLMYTEFEDVHFAVRYVNPKGGSVKTA